MICSHRKWTRETSSSIFSCLSHLPVKRITTLDWNRETIFAHFFLVENMNWTTKYTSFAAVDEIESFKFGAILLLFNFSTRSHSIQLVTDWSRAGERKWNMFKVTSPVKISNKKWRWMEKESEQWIRMVDVEIEFHSFQLVFLN